MYLLKLVSQQGQTLAQHTLQTGSVQRIAAMNNVHYQLADPQSGLAAQGVQASKAGEDLLVHINGEPALIIEDYFLLDNSGLKNPLLGLNGSGQYVAYPVGDASALAVEHLLAEEVAGAATTSAAAINPAIALATIGGVALTGAVIAGGSKNDSKSGNNTPQDQPQTPFDPNQPAPPVDNPPPGGGNNPPPGGGNNPPPGGGNNPPPGGGNNPPPGGGNNPPPGGGNNPPPSGGNNPPPGGGNNPPPGGGNTAPDSKDKPVPFEEDKSYHFSAADFAFNDPDRGQTLQAVRIDSLPDTGMLTLNGVAVTAGQIVAAADLNKLAYTSAENGNGDNYARFTFSVQDSEDKFDESPNTITFNVTPVNDAPQAMDDQASTKAGETVAVNVLENDSDVEGDALAITAATLTNPVQGQVEIVGNQIRFTPAAGVSGDVAIRYSVSDGKGGSDDATLTVTVRPDITPPVLAISAAQTNLKPGDNTQITFALSEKVKGFDASDVTAEGGTLSGFAKVNDTTYTAIFTAGANPGSAARVYVADNAFTDEANNPNQSTDLIFAIGDAPDKEPPTLAIKAEKTSLAPGQGTEITFELSEKVEGFEESDIEVQGGKLSNFAKITETIYTATFTAGNTGNASLRVASKAFKDAADNDNEEPSVLALTITNTAPDSKDKPVALVEDSSYSFSAADFAFNDPDQEQTLRAVRIDSLPDKGTLTLNGVAVTAGQSVAAADLNKLAYTPVENGNGDNYARFTFSVQDSEGAFDESPNTITFNVTPVNDAPMGDVTINGKANVGETLTVTHTLQDVDGLGLVTYRWFSGSEEVGVGNSYTISANDKGKRITVRADYTDGDGMSESVPSQPTAEVGDPATPLPPPGSNFQFIKGIGPEMQGGFTIIPPQGAPRFEIGFTNETGKPERVIVQKSPWGTWSFALNGNPNVSVDEKTGNITLKPDAIKDGSKPRARLGDSGGFKSGPEADADYVAPDAPIVSLKTGPQEIYEGGKSIYIVELDKPATQNVSVTIKASAKGNTNPSPGMPTVTIRAGETQAKFAVSAEDNQRHEIIADKIALELTNAVGATINPEHKEIPNITVIDNDPALVVRLDPGQIVVKEGHSAIYHVRLNKVAQEDVRVEIKLEPGSVSSDISVDKQVVIIPAGELSASFTVTAARDGEPEGLEEFAIKLDNPQGAIIEYETENLRKFNDVVFGVISDESHATPIVSLSGVLHRSIFRGESAEYAVKLDSIANEDVVVKVSTGNGAIQNVRIPAGESHATFEVSQSGTISLVSAQGAEIVNDSALNLGPNTFTLAINDGGRSNIFIASDIDPAQLPLNAQEIPFFLDTEAETLLARSASDISQAFKGTAGNDAMISLNSADTLQGGEGADSFVFVADGNASPTADEILDFRAGEDLIYLIGGQRDISISDISFDENTQTLYYQSGQGSDAHSHSIVIHSHGGPLQENDILNALNIL